MRWRTLLGLAAVVGVTAAFSFPESTSVRVKRQQCRCTRLANGGGMQCSCQRPLAMGQQQDGLASQVGQVSGNPQAKCHCIQIILAEQPTYNCMCDPYGATTTRTGVSIITTIPFQTQTPSYNPNPTGTTQQVIAPVTQPGPVYTTAPPTTPPPTTLPPITTPPPTQPPPPTFPTGVPQTLPPTTQPPTTLPPITTPPTTQAPVTIPTYTTMAPSTCLAGYDMGQTVPPSQACSCIMIRIHGPANAQYQCSCPGAANPVPVSTSSNSGGNSIQQVASGYQQPSLTGQYNDALPTPGPYNPQQTVAPSTTNPYPATGITNGSTNGCFCLDGGNPNLNCGCQCDCVTLTVTIPNGVCVCPQDENGKVVNPPPTTGSSTSLPPITTSPVYGQTTTAYSAQQTQQTQPSMPTQYPTQPGQYTQPSQPTYPGQTTMPTQSSPSYPTQYPTQFPTQYPTQSPSQYPTQYPTPSSSSYPTQYPSQNPTPTPSPYPTQPGRPTMPTQSTQQPTGYQSTFPPITTSSSSYPMQTTQLPQTTTQPPVTYPPIITTAPPATLPPQTLPPIVTTPAADNIPSTALPLTTTCILYPVSVGTQPCVCMPQYEQCAQNICCLGSRFRSQKDPSQMEQASPPRPVPNEDQESTFDIFVDMLNKIKNKFSSR